MMIGGGGGRGWGSVIVTSAPVIYKHCPFLREGQWVARLTCLERKIHPFGSMFGVWFILISMYYTRNYYRVIAVISVNIS